MTEKEPTVVCVRCRHYRVTWQPSHPYGCVAHGFKSHRNPALVVFESSGIACQFFEPKSPRSDNKTPG